MTERLEHAYSVESMEIVVAAAGPALEVRSAAAVGTVEAGAGVASAAAVVAAVVKSYAQEAGTAAAFALAPEAEEFR